MSIYSIIEFDDGLQIVPTIWLQENGKKCLWPKALNPLRINKAIANREALDAKLCETLTVLRIFERAGTYENGMSKLKLAEKLSEIDTESDGNNNSRQSRHKRARRTISSSDEEGSETYDAVQNKLPPLPGVPMQLQRSITGLESHDYPEPKIHKASTSRCNSQNWSKEPPQRNSDAATNCSSTDSDQVGKPSTSSCSRRNYHEKSNKEYTDTERESIASSISKCSRASEPKKSTEAQYITDTGFRTQLFRKLSYISHQLKVVNEKLDIQQLQNCSDVEAEETAEKVCDSYPVQNEEALSTLECNLESTSFAKKLVDCLKKIGGSDLHGVVVNILRRLLSDSVAEKYSWAGMRAKKAFKDLNICRVLINTVRKSYADATEKEIEEVTSKWLAQAKVRSVRKKQVFGVITERSKIKAQKQKRRAVTKKIHCTVQMIVQMTSKCQHVKAISLMAHFYSS